MKGIADFIGNRIVSPVVECVDVDGVMRRVHVDDVLQRINIDALLDRVDIDRLVDRVDLNRHVQKIDMNSLLDRVNVNSLIGRSDVAALLAQSTSGVVSHLLDGMRTQLIVLDLLHFTTMRRVLCRGSGSTLPPQPNGMKHTHLVPKKRANKAILVQGRYTGFVSKAFAILLDVMFVTFNFALFTILLQLFWIFFAGEERKSAQKQVTRDHIWVVVLYFFLWWLYFFLNILLTGRTVGMVIAGLQVVGKKDTLTMGQAFLRTLLLPLTVTFCPFLGIIGLLRADGRMLHDIVAGTGIVYSWDAEMAKCRQDAAKRAREQRRSYLTDDNTSSSSRSESLHSNHENYETFPDSGV